MDSDGFKIEYYMDVLHMYYMYTYTLAPNTTRGHIRVFSPGVEARYIPMFTSLAPGKIIVGPLPVAYLALEGTGGQHKA